MDDIYGSLVVALFKGKGKLKGTPSKIYICEIVEICPGIMKVCQIFRGLM